MSLLWGRPREECLDIALPIDARMAACLGMLRGNLTPSACAPAFNSSHDAPG